MTDQYQAHVDEVTLNGVPMVVRGPVSREVVNTFGRKVALGEPGPDSHPINSSWTQADWQGGGQILELNAATDMGRYWWSTCETMYPGRMTLPPLTHEYSGPNTTTPVIIGDFRLNGTEYLWASWGVKLRRWQPSTDTWVAHGSDLPNVATREGTQYALQSGANYGATWMFIPGGGFASVLKPDGSVSSLSGGAVDFAIWDEKLFRLTTAGKLEFTTDAVSWTQVGAVTDGSTPHCLTSGWNRGGDAVLYVSTDSALFALDIDAEKLRRTEVIWPRHPDQGVATVNHMGEGLYVSVGMGLHRYIGDVVTSDQGLDRAFGVPEEFRGVITSLESSYGMLFALSESVTSTEYSEFSLNMNVPEELLMNKNMGNALLMVWNGRGWHYRWSGIDMPASNVYASVVDSDYRIWWGAGEKAYCQKLSRTFFNPRIPTDLEVAETCTFSSGQQRWGWPAQPKIAKSLSVKCRNCSPTEYADAYYRTDDPATGEETPWVYAGRVDSDEQYRFYMNEDPVNPGRYRGIQHDWIEVRLDLARGNVATQYPQVEWFVVSGRKVMRPQRTWRFMVDLMEPFRGYTQQEMVDFLEGLVTSDPAVAIPFVDQDRTYMVDVVGVTFSEMAGKNKYIASINLIESLEVDAA